MVDVREWKIHRSFVTSLSSVLGPFPSAPPTKFFVSQKPTIREIPQPTPVLCKMVSFWCDCVGLHDDDDDDDDDDVCIYV